MVEGEVLVGAAQVSGEVGRDEINKEGWVQNPQETQGIGTKMYKKS